VSGEAVKTLCSKRKYVVYCNVRLIPSFSLAIGLLAACAHPRSGSPQQVADTTRRDSTFGGAPRREVVTGDAIRKDQPIEEALSGRFPGVDVSRTPDGGIAVRIRGGSSLMGSNEPLYVIDGVEISPGTNGALTGINPYDIESIEVLKDATSTAMYGSRGSNGVVLIKMKKPTSH
jgi:TonB-dependent SusC/RagA subfamily outer membrane receptor